MAHIKKRLEDLREVQILPKAKPFEQWNPEALAVNILGAATVTLSDWLHARLEQLVRERVPMEDVAVVNDGSWTRIRVAGVNRFEFKIKWVGK